MNPDQTAPFKALTLYLTNICHLLFASVLYIHVYFKLDLIPEANTMNPDQTALLV